MIDLNSISDFFYVDDREISGRPVKLIYPKKTKHIWEENELHLRSLITDPDGNVLSESFNKFFNYRENKEHDKITKKLIAEGKALFPEKMDGSLIIRSVIYGEVNLRTRGSHQLGNFERVRDLVEEKYPKLLDPGYMSNVTMLFEYTSPSNKIVLHYDEDSLTYFGYVKNHKFYSSVEHLDVIAEEVYVPTVSFHNFSNDVDNISSKVSTWENSEGIVVWCDTGDGLHLSKIKAF